VGLVGSLSAKNKNNLPFFRSKTLKERLFHALRLRLRTAMKTKRSFEFVGTAKEKIFTPIREILSAVHFIRRAF